MTCSEFEKFIQGLQDNIKFKSELFNLGYEDLYNFPEMYYDMMEVFIKKRFGVKGYNWISWYLNVKVPNPDFVLACDEFGLPICYSVSSLYDYINEK
jgi:hypothetical protein